jgi:YVTN family beta-propeller protein
VAALALLVAALPFSAAAGPTRSTTVQVAPDGVVFVVNPDSSTVARVEFSMHVGTLTHEAPVGAYPRTLALGGPYVFTANQNGDSVSRLDQADLGGGISHPLVFGCDPYGVAATPAGDRVVVTCQGSGKVVILDAGLNEIATIPVAWPNPRAVAISSDGTRAFVTHFLTEEPVDDAHVSVIDLTNNSVANVIAVPADTTTCENQNAGQGPLNLVSAVTIMPDGAPAEVAGQVWIGGTQQNNLNKGLFKRSTTFKGESGSAMFPFSFAPFPDGGGSRNVYKASFHDITRFGIYKLNAATGAVVGKIDIDEASTGTDIQFSLDGVAAYVVDHMFNSYHVFNTVKGQRPEDVTTLFAAPSRFGPGGAEDDKPCVPDALAPVTSERPFRMQPQAQITTIDGIDPADLAGMAVKTGVDFDAKQYMDTGESRMIPGGIPDGIGTAPMGVGLSPDGETVYVANYLSRNLVQVAGAAPLDGAGRPANLRCSNNFTQTCGTTNDCSAGSGFCNHPGGSPCTTDADCGSNPPCVLNVDCVPILLGAPVSTTSGADPLPAAILDGKILFNTAARDSSVPNAVGLDHAAPPFNGIDAAKTPGLVVSTSHDASYVTCTSCHADFGGQDGRTWDFSQFGASLRNTMDLRGRPGFAPGSCNAGPNVGQECFFDAACGDGYFCKAQDKNVPPNVQGVDRQRWFNPMLTVHWNGDRDEVEDFEHTYRSLMGAGDCDAIEDQVNGCLGALIQRSALTSSDPMDVNDDLGAPNRNIRGASGKIVGIRLSHMADFVYSLTGFVKNPNAPDEASERGRKIFNDPATRCAECHNGGPGAGHQFFTDKKPNPGFDPSSAARGDGNNPFFRHDVGTANVFDTTDPNAVAAQNQTFQNPRIPIPGSRGSLGDYVTPVLTDVWNTAPYLHDGSAHTLLDVVRPCNTTLDDCFQPGRGRNLNDLHGVTSMLSPDQLNDLVAFQKTLTVGTIVATNERVLDFGTLDLSVVTLKFGKTKKGATAAAGARGSFKVKGNLVIARAVDVQKGVELSLVTNDGEKMSGFSRNVALKGKGKRFSGKSTEGGGVVTVSLARTKKGFRLAASGKHLDLGAIQSGASYLMVSVDAGGTTFALNRGLVSKKGSFKLAKKKK